MRATLVLQLCHAYTAEVPKVPAPTAACGSLGSGAALGIPVGTTRPAGALWPPSQGDQNVPFEQVCLSLQPEKATEG